MIYPSNMKSISRVITFSIICLQIISMATALGVSPPEQAMAPLISPSTEQPEKSSPLDDGTDASVLHETFAAENEESLLEHEHSMEIVEYSHPIMRVVKDLPLNRPYERTIFAVYSGMGLTAVLLRLKGVLGQVQAETGLVLIWASMILSIPFLEAWVKFQAPFLRRHIAVDVGRHVLAALTTAELALSMSLAYLLWLAPNARAPRSTLLPGTAILLLLTELFLVTPKLYTRAKHKIVSQASADYDRLDHHEKVMLQSLSFEIQQVPLPTRSWQVLYVSLEAIKFLCLTRFIWWMWTNLSFRW